MAASGVAKVEVKGKNLVITIPMNGLPLPKSGSGKTLIVASTGGNKEVERLFDIGDGVELPMHVGVNVFVWPPRGA